MSQLLRNAHDRFLKQSMTNPKVAQEFFEQHLPDDLKKVVSFKNMEICQSSFIDKSLKLSEVDLLYKVDFNDVTGYIYILLEHQSTPDLKMPLRMYHYTVQILEKHIKNNPEFEYLPIIYPLVLYHHLKPYPYSNDIYHLFGPNEDLARRWVFQPFHLIDLSQVSDEQLKQKQWSGIMTWLLKNIYARDLSHAICKNIDLFKSIYYYGDENYLITILEYILHKGDLADKQELAKIMSIHLSPKVGETVMTLGERLIEQGRQEGLNQGLSQGRKEGRNEGRSEGAQETKKLIAALLAQNNINKDLIEEVMQTNIDLAKETV